jgi:16S rRNA (guanine527-N7)-methyltransferase
MSNNPANVSEETIRRALGEFGLSADEEQVLKIQQYIRMLLFWNEKLNLTAIRDPLEVLYRHFCESMFGALYLPGSHGRLADVGSGGGFPGLPLKIIKPGWHVFLIESNFKKATFLAEVVRELGVMDTRILVKRFEELSEDVAPLDVVCARALGEFPEFLAWAANPAVACGRVMLWIGGRDLDAVRKEPGWDWEEPVPIPHSLRRYLLMGNRASSR